MSTIAILVAAAAAVALLANARARNRGSSAASGGRRRPIGERARTAKFAAVEIKFAGDSCEAAKALAGEPILAAEAPALPLKGCDRQCRCAFIKRPDRREETRRWSDEGVAATVFAAKERRKRGERRRS